MARTKGAAGKALTAKVLEHYGNVCHLCRKPGATTKDHLIPYSHGGTDAIANLRPAHHGCNSRRGNRALGGVGADIRVVMGPPCAGKTTHVMAEATVADIIVDLDRLARALQPVQLDDRSHVYPQHIRHVAIGARAAAIDRASRLTNTGAEVWIIHGDPSPEDLDLYRFLRYQVITVDPGRAEVERRARAERPPAVWPFIARWYARHATLAALASAQTSTTPTPSDDPDW